jgi:hypothetical protein
MVTSCVWGEGGFLLWCMVCSLTQVVCGWNTCLSAMCGTPTDTCCAWGEERLGERGALVVYSMCGVEGCYLTRKFVARGAQIEGF